MAKRPSGSTGVMRNGLKHVQGAQAVLSAQLVQLRKPFNLYVDCIQWLSECVLELAESAQAVNAPFIDKLFVRMQRSLRVPAV